MTKKTNGQWTPAHDKALAGVLGNGYIMHGISMYKECGSEANRISEQVVALAESIVDAVEAKKGKKGATLAELKRANAKLEALAKTQARNIDEMQKRIATLEAVQQKYGLVRYKVEDLNNAFPKNAKPDIDYIRRTVDQAMEILHPKC